MRTPLPELDRTAAATLAAQIAGYYAQAIQGGRMRAGDRLPPIRHVSRACDVTRATVQDAYRHLAEQGLVEGTVGRGTTVIVGPGAASAGAGDAAPRSFSPYADAALRHSQEMPGAPPLPPGRALVANFAELAPDGARFPVDAWRTAMDAVLQTRGAELLGYGNATNGLPELRAMLAEREPAGDPRIGPDDVLVTAGAQQALDLVLRTFCAPGDTVVVTAPSYHQMHGLLRAHGLQVAPVPFGADGLDLDRLARVLQRDGVRLVYLMPTFHNPTGRSLDLTARRALVDVLARTAVPVVEDEYQSSLRCRGKAAPTLRSLDPRGLTVTASTASKELFPALRIGWIVASQDLLRPMAAVKRFMDLETSPLLQAALVEFVRRGSFDRYLGELRAELRSRHAALQKAARTHLPAGCSITSPDGGFVAWLELPEAGQGERLAELAIERGVRVVPGCVFDLFGQPSRGVRLSLTRADTEQITAGMRVLGQCARELLSTPAPARSFL
ncbi:MAG TPA: PLP-dependent aminotransferase family protein [Planctomycetota bacterium]|nr:PLP-dependent aminotransferase family protein [Planctomycetota bacterium]